MTNCTDLFKSLVESLSHEIAFVELLMRDTQSSEIAKQLPHAGVGLTPIVVFQLIDSSKEISNLLIGYAHGYFRVACVDRSLESIIAFANDIIPDEMAAEIPDLPEPIWGVFDINRLVMPIDSLAGIPIAIYEICVIEDTSKSEVVGIMLAFQHGFRIAFLRGYYGEWSVLFNDQTLIALEQARQLSETGRLRLYQHRYPRVRSNLVDDTPWFGA